MTACYLLIGQYLVCTAVWNASSCSSFLLYAIVVVVRGGEPLVNSCGRFRTTGPTGPSSPLTVAYVPYQWSLYPLHTDTGPRDTLCPLNILVIRGSSACENSDKMKCVLQVPVRLAADPVILKNRACPKCHSEIHRIMCHVDILRLLSFRINSRGKYVLLYNTCVHTYIFL